MHFSLNRSANQSSLSLRGCLWIGRASSSRNACEGGSNCARPNNRRNSNARHAPNSLKNCTTSSKHKSKTKHRVHLKAAKRLLLKRRTMCLYERLKLKNHLFNKNKKIKSKKTASQRRNSLTETLARASPCSKSRRRTPPTRVSCSTAAQAAMTTWWWQSHRSSSRLPSANVWRSLKGKKRRLSPNPLRLSQQRRSRKTKNISCST